MLEASAPPFDHATERQLAARKGLLIFLCLTFAFSYGIEFAMIRSGKPIDTLARFTLLLMWSPALASVLCRLVLREGFRDGSFRVRGPVREWLWAWLAPVWVGCMAYGGAWTSGLESARVPGTWQGWSLPGAFFAKLGLALSIGIPTAALTALGEEIGWRGYMLPRLIESGVHRPVLWSGVIWAAWHLPLILSGQYASGPVAALSVLSFTTSVIAVSYLMARVRLATNSVWPAVVLHASWNSVIQGVFDRLTATGSVARTESVWTGEGGLLVAAAALLVCGFATWNSSDPYQGESQLRAAAISKS